MHFVQKIVMFTFLVGFTSGLSGAEVVLRPEPWVVVDKKGNETIFEWDEIERFDSVSAGDAFVRAFTPLAELEQEATARRAEHLSVEIEEMKRGGSPVKEIVRKESYRELLELDVVEDISSVMEEEWKEGLVDPEKSYIVTARREDRVVGFAIFSSCDELPDIERGTFSIDYLVVHPDAQGCGLARHLVFSILNRFPETKEIMLSTPNVDSTAVHVYSHLGFKPAPVTEGLCDPELLLVLSWKQVEA
jgi:ribosomal protein S18 acetylase RimI-like enzyme